jgi:DNA-binding transcriptional ArsR family regulator
LTQSTTDAAPDIIPLFKALADETRIRIMASVTGRARSVEEIAADLSMATNQVSRHLGNLLECGLLETGSRKGLTVYRFRRRPLLEALHSLTPPKPQTEYGSEVDDFDQKVLSVFLIEGKLTAIPAQQKKRDAILRFLTDQFEGERMYLEMEVNKLLADYHADVASLRRYLVDGGFLKRQIVREVAAEALMAGNPEVTYRNMYWKPKPGSESASVPAPADVSVP